MRKAIRKARLRGKLRVDNFLSYTARRVNGSLVDGLLVEADGLSFLVPPADMVVGRALRRHGSYEKEGLALIEKLTTADSVVAFIGAHIGIHAIPTAKRVRRAYLFEANPETYGLLARNVALNGVENVELFNTALGERSGEVDFLLNRTNSGGSKRAPKVKDFAYYYDSPKTIKVPMVSFDSLADSLSSLSGQKFDLILMDIEGSEYFALQGMQEVLGRTENLVIEFIGHHLRNVAGVSVAAFLDLIEPHFAHLYIPSLNRCVERGDFLSVLQKMYDTGADDSGILFSKSPYDRHTIGVRS